MGAFLDSIFNRTYYKEVLASYELVNNKFYDAYKIWLEHESNEDDCTYSFKIKVHNNLENIKQIDKFKFIIFLKKLIFLIFLKIKLLFLCAIDIFL